MGTKWVLHFDDEKFLASINQAKWNIYSVALQDLNFLQFILFKVFYDYKETDNATNIYEEILNQELQMECQKRVF